MVCDRLRLASLASFVVPGKNAAKSRRKMFGTFSGKGERTRKRKERKENPDVKSFEHILDATFKLFSKNKLQRETLLFF